MPATLVAFEDNGDFGWMVKRVDGIAEGVQVERAIVVGNGYAIDVLEWKADNVCAMELPIAGKADIRAARREMENVFMRAGWFGDIGSSFFGGRPILDPAKHAVSWLT